MQSDFYQCFLDDAGPFVTEQPQNSADQANHHQRVRKLFDEASDLEDMERRWFLQSIEDRDLAADVERLLESSACCGSFRDPKVSDSQVSDITCSDPPVT